MGEMTAKTLGILLVGNGSALCEPFVKKYSTPSAVSHKKYS
jgi:hypothetical protein